jgi:hypothetical protein
MKELASVAGLTLDVEFSVYGLWRNYTGYDCGKVGDVEFGKPENGTRFYFTGKAPSFNFASLTAEQKVTLIQNALVSSVEIPSNVTKDTEVTLPSLDATKFPGVTATWSLADGADSNIFTLANGKLTIKPTEQERKATLKLNVEYGADTPFTKDFEIKASSVNVKKVENVEAGKTYKVGIVNTNKGEDIYFLTGAMAGTYAGSTTSISQSADFTIEEVTGGFNLASTVSGVKSYVNLYKQEGKSYVGIYFEETASSVYTWDAATKTVKTVYDNKDQFIGTSNTNKYTTVGAVKNATDYFVVSFYTVE